MCSLGFISCLSLSFSPCLQSLDSPKVDSQFFNHSCSLFDAVFYEWREMFFLIG